jgi:isochorismate hydrolase
MKFLVSVAVADSTILITLDEHTGVHNPDLSGSLPKRAIRQLSLFFVIISLCVSTVGDAFTKNIQNLQIRQSLSRCVNASSETVLRPVADLVTAMVHDALTALTSAASTFPNSTKITSA